MPLSRERALLIYAQAQKRFLIVRIHRLVKMMPICFLKKMRNYFLFCRIYNRNCYHTVFNLSSKVLTDTEINILERGWDFAPIQYKNNQPELSKDFEEFCSRMRIKWYFPNDISENFSEKLAFTPKSKWNPPKDHPSLEVFLSPIEKELFVLAESPFNYSNEKYQAMRSLVNDRSLVIIKKVDKGSCFVVCNLEHYIAKTERQLGDVTVYKDVDFKEE